MKRLLLTFAFSLCCWGYVPNPIGGTPLHRLDFATVQFMANSGIAAGIQTSDGKVWITADSSPLDALKNALQTWNGVATSAARFAPLQMTGLGYGNDGSHVITFADDPFTRSF